MKFQSLRNFSKPRFQQSSFTDALNIVDHDDEEKSTVQAVEV